VLRCYWWLAGGAGVGVWFSFFAVPGYDGIGILEMAFFGFSGWVWVQWVFYGIINEIFWNLCYKTITQLLYIV